MIAREKRLSESGPQSGFFLIYGSASGPTSYQKSKGAVSA